MGVRYSLDEYELQDEERCEDVHHRGDLLEVSADYVQQYIRDHSD